MKRLSNSSAARLKNKISDATERNGAFNRGSQKQVQTVSQFRVKFNLLFFLNNNCEDDDLLVIIWTLLTAIAPFP